MPHAYSSSNGNKQGHHHHPSSSMTLVGSKKGPIIHSSERRRESAGDSELERATDGELFDIIYRTRARQMQPINLAELK